MAERNYPILQQPTKALQNHQHRHPLLRQLAVLLVAIHLSSHHLYRTSKQVSDHDTYLSVEQQFSNHQCWLGLYIDHHAVSCKSDEQMDLALSSVHGVEKLLGRLWVHYLDQSA